MLPIIFLFLPNLKDVIAPGDPVIPAEGRNSGRVGTLKSQPQGRRFGLTIHLPPKLGSYHNNPQHYEERPKPGGFHHHHEDRTETVVEWRYVGSTGTLAEFKSCIGSSQFVTNVGVTSTLPCSRRRRSAEMANLLVEITPVLP